MAAFCQRRIRNHRTHARVRERGTESCREAQDDFRRRLWRQRRERLGGESEGRRETESSTGGPFFADALRPIPLREHRLAQQAERAASLPPVALRGSCRSRRTSAGRPQQPHCLAPACCGVMSRISLRRGFMPRIIPYNILFSQEMRSSPRRH